MDRFKLITEYIKDEIRGTRFESHIYAVGGSIRDLLMGNEIKDIDFNKLIKETLKDKETYDILDLQDVKVDFITDEEGNITKEILTISLNAKYDVLLSAMDAKVTLTLEINF